MPRHWQIARKTTQEHELPRASARPQNFGFESRRLWDAPAAIPDDIGRAVRNYVDRQVEAVQKTIFPFHRL